MTGIILKILSVIGITLLLLLGILLTLLFLVLFCPVCYCGEGRAEGENKELKVRVSWLLGLIRVLYSFPNPGGLKAKIFFFTAYNSQKQKKASAMKKQKKKADSKDDNSTTEILPEEGNSNTTPKMITEENTGANIEEHNQSEREESDSSAKEADSAAEKESTASNPEAHGNIFEKIKYTIQGIYDKIKKVWDNISYYRELLQEENTKCLWAHVKQRMGKILQSIRPRHLKADITFGTGSPDTTGYIFAFYGILSPYLGKDVRLTPDFQQAIVNGRFKVSGHITCIVLLFNGLSLLFDKKMKIFLRKMKAGRKKDG